MPTFWSASEESVFAEHDRITEAAQIKREREEQSAARLAAASDHIQRDLPTALAGLGKRNIGVDAVSTGSGVIVTFTPGFEGVPKHVVDVQVYEKDGWMLCKIDQKQSSDIPVGNIDALAGALRLHYKTALEKVDP